MNEANIDGLVGRHYASKSKNIARIERIGEGAIRAVWMWPPSEADQVEFQSWVEGILGPINVTKNVGRDSEAEEYSKWRTRA